MEENGMPGVQEFSNGEKSGKGKKIAIVILMILVLLSAGALAAVNFFPEVIFSPKTIYLMAEKQNMMLLQKQIDDYFNDGFVKDGLKVYSTPFSSNSELTFKYKLDNFQGQEAEQLKMINNILSASKLVINASSDYKNEKTKGEYKLNIKGNDLITAEVFADKKKIGIRVPAFYNKYVVVNGDDMAPVFEKFNQPVQMRKIITNADIIKAIKFDKKEAFDLVNGYSEYLAKQLKDGNFKFTKGASIQTKDGNISCNQVTLRLTAAEMKNIAIKMLEKAQNDDKLLNLMAGNIINVMKLYEEAGYYGTEGLPVEFKDISTVKEKIKQAIDEMKKDTSAEQNKSELAMTLMIDNRFKIFERKIEAIIKAADSTAAGTVTIRFAGFTQPKSKAFENIFEFKVDGNSDISRFTIDAVQAPKVQGKPVTTAINIEAVQNENGTEIKPFTGRVDLSDDSIKDKSRKLTANYEFKISSNGTEIGTISGAINANSTRDSAQNKTDFSMDTTVKPPSIGQQANEFGFVLGLTSTTKFGTPVSLPSIDAGNSLYINTASMQEIQDAVMQIQTEAQKFLMQNAQLFAPSGM